MPAGGESQIDNRVVLQFRVRLEVQSDGRMRLIVETLDDGVTVAVFEGTDFEDVDRKLRRSKYQRIPPGFADILDVLRQREPERK